MANNQGQQTRAQNLQRRRDDVINRQNQLKDEFQSLIAEETSIKAELASIQVGLPKRIASTPFLEVKEVCDGTAD
jgi:hypothetical protein